MQGRLVSFEYHIGRMWPIKGCSFNCPVDVVKTIIEVTPKVNGAYAFAPTRQRSGS